MFLIIYARIIDNKKKGLELEGPYFGPECKTMKKAHEECTKLATPSKDHLLFKIYDLEEMTHLKAKELASDHFDKIFEQMQVAQSFCDAPRRKRIKR